MVEGRDFYGLECLALLLVLDFVIKFGENNMKKGLLVFILAIIWAVMLMPVQTYAAESSFVREVAGEVNDPAVQYINSNDTVALAATITLPEERNISISRINWSLTTIDGQTITKSTYADKVVLMVFCKASSGALISQLAQSSWISAADIQVIVVDNAGNTVDEVKAFKEKYAPDCDDIVFTYDNTDNKNVMWTLAKLHGMYELYYSYCSVIKNDNLCYAWDYCTSAMQCQYALSMVSSVTNPYYSDNADGDDSTLATPKLTAVFNEATGVKITWGAVSGAEKYRVYYKNSSGGWTRIADVADTSYTWTGAESGTKYTFTVRCISSDGNSTTSSFDSTGKSITYIVAPKISALTNERTGVKITWGAVSGAEKYRVYYKTGSGSWTKVAEVTDTSYIWTGAKSGTNYTFTVRCISSDGKSTTSGFDSTGKSITYTATGSASNLATPVLTAVTNSATGVKITWGAVSGAEKYRVYYKNSSGGWTKIADVTGTSYTWTGAESGTKYTFTVRCISSDGKSATSSFDSTGKSITYIAAPKISALTNEATGVKITWGAVSGAEKYRVYYKNSSGGWTKIADVTDTSYTWTEAENETNYTFTVRCISSDGKSTISGYDSNGKSITYIAVP